jgi:hypothetical protein
MEQAISECEAISAQAACLGPQWLHRAAEESTTTMRSYLASVQSGLLARPSGGAGLGFSRGLGEWADGQERLMALAYTIDRFYKMDCNCSRAE